MSTYDKGGTPGLTAFRIRDEQRKLLDDAAKSEGVTRSEFVRFHSLAAADRILRRKESDAA